MSLNTQSLSYATNSVALDTSAIFGVLDLFQSNLPASYIRAFLAVAKDPGRTVGDYARVCGVGNGPMSMPSTISVRPIDIACLAMACWSRARTRWTGATLL
jgi:hypothetical protein